MTATELRNALVDRLVRGGRLLDPAVEAAFRKVPRHLFTPGVPLEAVYSDRVIVTKRQRGGELASSSSQPAIMATMLEQLAVAPGHRVLEIGAGTGYNAALLAHLVGANGHVTTLDLDRDLVEGAREHLAAASVERVAVVLGDGAQGHARGAPYDRILVTAGAWDLAPAWSEQLAPAGRLVVPLRLGGIQASIAFEREDDHLASVAVAECGFLPLRGEMAPPRGHTLVLGGGLGATLSMETEPPTSAELFAEQLSDWLREDTEDRPTGVAVTLAELFRGLGLWLSLHEPGLGLLTAPAGATGSLELPVLYTRPGPDHRPIAFTVVLPTEAGVAALGGDHRPGAVIADPERDRFGLTVRQFGAARAPADRLLAHVVSWQRAGRPEAKGLQVRAYAAGRRSEATPRGPVLVRPHTLLELSWPDAPGA